MSQKFRAAVLRQPGLSQAYADSKPLQIEEVSVDAPHEGEVLVRIAAASLCRSDLSVVTGVRAWPLPIIPGHEASGIVEEVGAGVNSVKPGDHVVLVFQPSCGACPDCVSGQAHLCGPGLQANRSGGLLAGGTRLRQGEVDIHHHMGLSAFAEFAVVSEHSVVPLPKDLPLDVAALFGCAVMCGAGTVLNTGNVRPGDTVTIVGAGGVGSSAILGAKLAGAKQIIVADKDPRRLEFAKKIGATDIVQEGPDPALGSILELSHGGTDFAFETAGTLGAFETAYGAVRRGGTVVSVGLVSPETPFSLDVASLVTSAKTVKGSYVGSCNPTVHIPKYVDLFQSGQFPVDQLISHHLPLDDINTALDRMADNEAVRQIITP
ncbi:MAG: alcohol dehydrogenase catalytic domain-containing protein [Alphaproteobacteria bacterium]|jgi:alcohol dehydrogenase|nr:alcohol dehydrogenase catalytic domain-containing protein [Alphaproteobacteria bacterium]MBT4084728.1 alcohol dehydrogenase catalytic domain-containing protein [Alphaproteobacteria bacterium]MBT4544684.1 alcohol dehydrogenase catalytic domain-containing protein [Alphaproteobacteria bacterium]MBT7744902.1 alcohol dehydrogenase catalytic domain-containing protein [Alphaproteobacteria bacterium]